VFHRRRKRVSKARAIKAARKKYHASRSPAMCCSTRSPTWSADCDQTGMSGQPRLFTVWVHSSGSHGSIWDSCGLWFSPNVDELAVTSHLVHPGIGKDIPPAEAGAVRSGAYFRDHLRVRSLRLCGCTLDEPSDLCIAVGRGVSTKRQGQRLISSEQQSAPLGLTRRFGHAKERGDKQAVSRQVSRLQWSAQHVDVTFACRSSDQTQIRHAVG